MTSKEKLIKWIEEMPDDLQYFYEELEHDAIDIRIFTKPKSQEFLEWYFGP